MNVSLSKEECDKVTAGKYLLFECAEEWYKANQEGMDREDVCMAAFIAGAQAMLNVVMELERLRATESKLNEWHSTTKQ